MDAAARPDTRPDTRLDARLDTRPQIRPVGVFDSGLGGLTVVRALMDLLPQQPLIYFGDTGRFPYGPKPAHEVLKYSIQITDVLMERDVSMIVVACNSATAASLDQLQARVDVPVVGVIDPGLRSAAKTTLSGRVGVIGTVGTIRSGAYQRAGRRIAADLDLVCAACPGFVEFVESGEIDSDQVYVLAERLLAPIKAANVDALVLGCTHYPLLARTIADVVGRDVVLVSSAEETAFEVRSLLGAQIDEHASDGISNPRATHTFLTSGDTSMFQSLGERFCGPEVASVEAWQW